MFFLDKLVYKWILAKCSELGEVFMLGPLEGGIIYLGIFAIGIVEVMGNKEGSRK